MIKISYHAKNIVYHETWNMNMTQKWPVNMEGKSSSHVKIGRRSAAQPLKITLHGLRLLEILG